MSRPADLVPAGGGRCFFGAGDGDDDGGGGDCGGDGGGGPDLLRAGQFASGADGLPALRGVAQRGGGFGGGGGRPVVAVLAASRGWVMLEVCGRLGRAARRECGGGGGFGEGGVDRAVPVVSMSGGQGDTGDGGDEGAEAGGVPPAGAEGPFSGVVEGGEQFVGVSVAAVGVGVGGPVEDLAEVGVDRGGVEQGAEHGGGGVHVAAWGARRTGADLGGGVADRAGAAVGLAAVGAGEAEVDEFRGAGGVEHDVGRADVAVHHTLAVRGGQADSAPRITARACTGLSARPSRRRAARVAPSIHSSTR